MFSSLAVKQQSQPYLSSESFHHRHFVREAVHRVYNSIIIGKLLYAVSAFRFASTADRQRLQAFLQRCVHSGLYSPETPSLTELAESIDDALFQRIMHNPYHVLHHSLHELVYNIRPRQ